MNWLADNRFEVWFSWPDGEVVRVLASAERFAELRLWASCAEAGRSVLRERDSEGGAA